MKINKIKEIYSIDGIDSTGIIPENTMSLVLKYDSYGNVEAFFKGPFEQGIQSYLHSKIHRNKFKGLMEILNKK